MKTTWIKRHFDCHDKEEFLKLAEEFGSDGFLTYDFFISFLGKNEEFSIERNSMKFKLFSMTLEMIYKISSDKSGKIIDKLIELSVIKLESDNLIIVNELKTTFEDVEKATKQRIEAGKASAEKRKKRQQELDKDKKKFSKFDLEGYEGTFPNNEQDEPTKIEDHKALNGNKYYNEFVEICTEYFSIIPEPQMLKNKQEKLALKLFLNFIKDNHLDRFSDENYLRSLANKVKIQNNNPDFYLSKFYDSLIKELKDVQIENKDNPIDWIEEVLKKYDFIRNMEK